MAQEWLSPETVAGQLDRLYRAALALTGRQADAEDLVQDTIVQVLARPRRVQGSEGAYLLAALRHTHANRRRAAGRRPRTAPLDEEVRPARGPDPSERAALYAAIAALPSAQRDALVAVDVAGLSYAEAGLALEVPEGTVATRLFRARAALAGVLRGQ